MLSASQVAPPVCSAIALPLQQPLSISSHDLRARWISADDLAARQSAWDFLSENALQTNPAFESNYLIPALRHLASDAVQVIIVEDWNASEVQNIVAVVPIETKRMYQLPFKTAEVWRHDQCFNTTPLLFKDCAAKAWSLVCDLLVSDGYSLLSLDTVPGKLSIGRIWGQSLAYQNLVFSLKPGLAQTAVRALPKIQRVLKKLKNMKSGKSTGTKA